MKFIKKDFNISTSNVNKFAEEFNISPIIMEQIIARGNDSKEKITEFLKPSLKSYHDPFLLKGMKEFVDRINVAITKNEKILIFGDYDVDGISATTIMIKTLKILGCNPDFYLPNRYVDGYGLTLDVIDKIKSKHNPNLIITVDCGISCYKEVAYAKNLGIEIIITDHHEIPETVPEGIVLNAKFSNQKYPFKELCGAGLAYKISQALIGIKAQEFLPIACIATISDIVPIVDENRAIVYHGLKNLNLLPLGIKELFKYLNIKFSKCTANDISFKVAPKLNASGRMGCATDSLKLYFLKDLNEIKNLINKIINHNIKRQNLCAIVEADCNVALSNVNMSRVPCIILSSKKWDHGILGIVCAKLVSKYNRPVFLFSEIDGVLKGSARSIPSINVHKLLSSYKELLESYGGHPIAAGMTLKVENYHAFIKNINDFVSKNHLKEIFSSYENYDILINVNNLTPKLMKDTFKLEPCGCGNLPLRFLIKTNNFSFLQMKNHINHCNFKIGNNFNLVYFNFLTQYNLIKKAKIIDFLFELQYDNFTSGFKGIIKTINCNLNELTPFSQNFIIPQFEQLKYLDIKTPAKFSYYNSNNMNFELKKHLNTNKKQGTAFIINSERGLNILKKNFKHTLIEELDIYSGKQNSGVNCIFICPENLNFVKNYDNIVLLENVINFSYISKINQISDAKVFVNNLKENYNVFYSLNISRENFGYIFKDLEKFQGKYINIYDIYEIISKSKKINYSYDDFYCAFLVFKELKLIKIDRHETIREVFELKINKKIQSSLNKSKIYNIVGEIKKSLIETEKEVAYQSVVD